MSRKDLEGIICIACGKEYGAHTRLNAKKFSRRALMECFFRVQGSYVSDGIENHPPIEKPKNDDIDINITLDEMSSPATIDSVEWKNEDNS